MTILLANSCAVPCPPSERWAPILLAGVGSVLIVWLYVRAGARDDEAPAPYPWWAFALVLVLFLTAIGAWILSTPDAGGCGISYPCE